MTIINIKHRKGATTEAYIAKVSYKGIQFYATYDCLIGNIIIDKWYAFDDVELQSLRKELNAYFQELVSKKRAS